MMTRRCRSGAAIVVAISLAIIMGPVRPVFAEGITKVRGQVVDLKGKPMAKVLIYLEGVDINKTVGPLKTNKKGKFFIATLDVTVVRKWRVIPRLPGYKVVKVSYEIIESTGAQRDKREMILGSKQKFPDLPFALVGDTGRNVVDFVLAKDSEFVAAVLAEKRKRQVAAGGGDDAGTAMASAAAESSAPAVPDVPTKRTASLAKSLATAKQLTDAGRHKEAIELYNAFLSKDPTGNPAAYYYLGKSLSESGDDPAAERAFRKGLELKPDMRGAHFFLGNIAMKEQNPGAAIVEYEQELARSPDSDAVHFNLGKGYQDLGEGDKALAAYERAATINPGKSEIYLMMAAIYEERLDTAKAEEMYQKVIALDPKNAAISFYNIGVHAWNENNGKEAAQAFRKSLELDPAYAVTHRELARALMGVGDFAGALKHFEEYLKIKPRATDAKEIRDSISMLKN